MYCALRNWQIIPGVDQPCRTAIIDRGNKCSDDRSLARVSVYSPRASGRDRGEVMGPYPCTCCNDRIGGHRKERELTTQLLLVTEGRQYGRIVLDRD